MHIKLHVEEEIEPRIERLGKRRWTWYFECFADTIGFHRYVQFPDVDRSSKGDRGRLMDYYVIRFLSKWRVGTQHIYYDGPHCSLYLGFIQLDWRNDRCKQCHEGMPDH